jgi:hypothetical protein
VTTPTIELLSPDLIDKDVIVSLDDEDGGDVEGRCIAANEKAIVVKMGSKSRLIERHEILDIEVVDRSRPKKIVVRWIAEVTPESVRQHLADRHGMPVDLVPQDAESAMRIHGSIDHDSRRLGHRHGVKPKRQRRGVQSSPEEIAKRAAQLGVAGDAGTTSFTDGSDEDDDE